MSSFHNQNQNLFISPRFSLKQNPKKQGIVSELYLWITVTATCTWHAMSWHQVRSDQIIFGVRGRRVKGWLLCKIWLMANVHWSHWIVVTHYGASCTHHRAWAVNCQASFPTCRFNKDFVRLYEVIPLQALTFKLKSVSVIHYHAHTGRPLKGHGGEERDSKFPL